MSLDFFNLPRPEYTRQPESLVTDLVWGSLGGFEPALPDGGHPRMLPVLDRANPKYTGPDGSLPLAMANIGAGSLFLGNGPDEQAVLRAVFTALFAPRAKASKTGSALVMVNPDLAALQNLRGFTNKPQPPNYNRIFEQFARLGGADTDAAASRAYRGAYQGRALIREGATGFLESGLTTYCREAFESFGLNAEGWPDTAPEGLPLGSGSPVPAAAWLRESPFAWFWQKWAALHGDRGWRDVLPARRFADWQTCIARTALAMGYLYEAQVMSLMRDALAARVAGDAAAAAGRPVLHHLGPSPRAIPLGRVFAATTPPAAKGCWPWVQGVVRQGLAFRAAARDADTAAFDQALADGASPGEAFNTWLDGVDLDSARALLEAATPSASEGNNLLEFIRHLLRPLEDRADETGFGDRADLYGLLRANQAGTWFEPGPEWLVPVASLLAPRPGGDTTLNHVRRDLSRLGLECERDVLVGLLESCGLTTDSPDADDGLVVRSGF